ncbi:MAG: HEPN domain-containing protein [Candidatus Gracilibacteria bacterium]|nr:HEPN domain-containing protein [Candidatus Gracilibacteria bacterium]
MKKLSDSGDVENRIISWYKKGEQEKDAFDRYIYFWIAFNGYYYAYRLDTNSKLKNDYKIFLDGKSDSENQQIQFVAKEFKETFQKKIADETIDSFDSFFDFQKNRKHSLGTGGVINLMANETVNYKQKEKLGQLLKMLYQIRCNLFHGGKCADIENDKKLVKEGSAVLQFFLERVLELNEDVHISATITTPPSPQPQTPHSPQTPPPSPSKPLQYPQQSLGEVRYPP